MSALTLTYNIITEDFFRRLWGPWNKKLISCGFTIIFEHDFGETPILLPVHKRRKVRKSERNKTPAEPGRRVFSKPLYFLLKITLIIRYHPHWFLSLLLLRFFSIKLSTTSEISAEIHDNWTVPPSLSEKSRPRTVVHSKALWTKPVYRFSFLGWPDFLMYIPDQWQWRNPSLISPSLLRALWSRFPLFCDIFQCNSHIKILMM